MLRGGKIPFSFLPVLGLELGALCMLGKSFTTDYTSSLSEFPDSLDIRNGDFNSALSGLVV